MASPYKTAALFTIIPLALLFIVLALLSFWMEPFRGDLTRISGMPANFYGWKSEQVRFKEPLFEFVTNPKQARKPYEIIVLGDSFSQDLEHGWINYLAAYTGWSAVRYDIRTVRPEDIINTKYYQQSPPKLFIYQTVERRLIERATRLKTYCIADTQLQKALIPYDFKPRPPLKTLLTKRLHPKPKPFQFDAPIQFIKQHLFNKNKVLTAALNTTDLFSSNRPDTLLYLREDLEKFPVTEKQKTDSRCGLKDLQYLIEANGKTNFLALVAPDKSNMYADYMPEGGKFQNDIHSIIAAPVKSINLDKRLKQKIQEKVQDVYLPDDTHWGKAGYSLVGKSVAEYLQ